MSNYITARLATWSTLVTPKGDGFTGKVTKAAVRRTIASEHHRKMELYAVAATDGRTGYFFIDDLDQATVELRYNGDRDVMLLEVTPSGVTVR
jgi:hypothetical protein